MNPIRHVSAKDFDLPDGEDNRPQSILESDFLNCFPNLEADQTVSGKWQRLIEKYGVHTVGTKNVAPWVVGMNSLITDWNALLEKTEYKAPSPKLIADYFNI